VAEQKVALVTGAASGIGRATAFALANAGYALAISDRNGDGLGAVEREIVTRDIDVLSVVADVEKSAALDQLVASVTARFKRLDTLVQIAGIGCYKPFWEVSDAEIDHVLAVNVRSLLALATRCLPLLRASRGTIVNMSSVRAFRGGRELAVYSASKGAVLAMTRSMAHELGPCGIRVNALCPGTIDTPLLDTYAATQGDAAAFKASLHGEQPLGRIGSADDVARAAVYLATAASEWITGIGLTVDGGLTS
jgi:NAD(P)-dependent dehydrogenase (short-subunit alcohol dehydrogenase family)